MPFFFFDSTMLLLIPAILLSLYAQYKVKSAYRKYSEIGNSAGISGAQTAAEILRRNGIYDVGIEEVPGVLSDHYDPAAKKVRLSSGNYHGRSIAAMSVAAHEVGHAIQHNTGYAPLNWRHAILPVANIGSTLAFPLLLAGMIFSFKSLIDIGILFFAGAVLFQMVTLPVEFNASSRALRQIGDIGLVPRGELSLAKKVLNAAALTYVAAAAVAVLELVRLLILRNASE